MKNRSESGGRQTDGTKAYGYRIGYQTDNSREHGLEAQSDKDGCRDGYCRTETSHTLEHTSEAPRQKQYEQTLVGGHLDKLRLDGLDLLRLTKDIVAEDGADDNQDDGETGLEETLDHRPKGDAIDRHTGILLGHNTHGGGSKQGQNDCYDKSDHGTLITRHFEAHHEDNEQQNRND